MSFPLPSRLREEQRRVSPKFAKIVERREFLTQVKDSRFRFMA